MLYQCQTLFTTVKIAPLYLVSDTKYNYQNTIAMYIKMVYSICNKCNKMVCLEKKQKELLMLQLEGYVRFQPDGGWHFIG